MNSVAAVETNGIPEKSPSITSYTPSISQVVNDTVKDQLRRKKNIIMSGLSESNDVSDASVLHEICEVHLQFKPRFDESKCRRIGISNPRRFLVSLASEQAASELLYAARKNIKNVCNDNAASTIFFNTNLSPEDAHKAYLKRQERRSKRSGQTRDAATGYSCQHLKRRHTGFNIDFIIDLSEQQLMNSLIYLSASSARHVDAQSIYLSVC